MGKHIYRSEEFTFDPYQTNGTPGGRKTNVGVSAYDTGSLQLNIDIGPVAISVYPDPTTLRRLGEALVKAADGAESAMAHHAKAEER